MTSSEIRNELQLLADLQAEMRRLEDERSRAAAKQDRVFAIVEAGDDSGIIFDAAWKRVLWIEERLDQIRAILAHKQMRLKQFLNRDRTWDRFPVIG